MIIAEQEKAETVEAPKRSTEAKERTVEEPELKKPAGQPKTLIPPQEPESTKVSKIPVITPKRRRMASVLDAVMESARVQVPVSTLDKEGDIPKKSDEARISQDTAEAGPRSCTEANPSGATLILEKESTPEKIKSSTPEAPTEELDFIIRHALGKHLSEEHIAEAKQYARDLKYPKGSLVYDGTDEDDFLYCLPDSKEISVYQEMTENIGFPKLELGLSATSKDDLADNCWGEGKDKTGKDTLRLIRHQAKACDVVIPPCGLVQLRGPRVIRPIVTGPAWPPRVTGLICKGIPVITVCNPALWEYSGDNLGG
jgi:hypothetical protein